MSDNDNSEKKDFDPSTPALATLYHHGTPPYQSNADDALKMIESGTLGPIDPEKSKRLLRRIDLYIMPLICMYVPLPHNALPSN